MQFTNQDIIRFLAMLPALSRLFLLFVLCVVIYTLYSSLRILLSLRSLKTAAPDETLRSTKKVSDSMSSRITNLRQLHAFTLLFFGLCIAQQVYSSLNPWEIGGMTYKVWIAKSLSVASYYDAMIFLILLALHSLQWVVSAHVNSFTRSLYQLKPP